MPYKPYSDSTLMSMNKRQIIEQLRIAEHNFSIAEQTLDQQALKVRSWEPVLHCSNCKYLSNNGPYYCRKHDIETTEFDFCSFGERK